MRTHTLDGKYNLFVNPHIALFWCLIIVLNAGAGFAGFTVGTHYYLELFNNPVLLAILFGIPNFIGGLLRIPSAAQVSISGGRGWLIVQMTFTVIGLLILFFITLFNLGAFSFAAFYSLAIISAICLGFSVASFSVCSAQLNYWYPHHKTGLVLAIFASMSLVIPNIFIYGMSALTDGVGISYMYLIWALIIVVLSIIYFSFSKLPPFFQLRNKLRPQQAMAIAHENKLEAFPINKNYIHSLINTGKYGITWAITFLIFTSLFVSLLTTAWAIQYLQKFHFLSPTTAGLIALILAAIAFFTRVTEGFFVDKINIKLSIVVPFVFAGIGCLILALSSNLIVDCVMLGLVLSAGGIAGSGAFKSVGYYLGPHVASGLGIASGIGSLAGCVAPLIMSAFLGHYKTTSGIDLGYQYGFYVPFVMVVVAIIVTICLKETQFSKENKKKSQHKDSKKSLSIKDLASK